MKRLLIVLACAPCMYGATPLETLKKVKTDLQEGQNNVSKAIGQLATAFNSTQNTVVKKLEKAAIDLNPQVNLLTKAYNYSQVIRVTLTGLTATVVLAPITVPALALFGDLPEIIKGILDTVSSIQNTLWTVDSTIVKANANLQPASTIKQTMPTKLATLIAALEQRKTEENKAKFDLIIVPLQAIAPQFEKLDPAQPGGYASAVTGLGRELAKQQQQLATIPGTEQEVTFLQAIIDEIKADTTADPKGVYKKLQSAQEKFGQAVTIVDNIVTRLEKLAEEF